MNKYAKEYFSTLDKVAFFAGAYMPGQSMSTMPAPNAANGDGLGAIKNLLGKANAGAEDAFGFAGAVGKNMLTGIGNAGRALVGAETKPMDAPFTPVKEQIRGAAIGAQGKLVDNVNFLKQQGNPQESFKHNPQFKQLVTEAGPNAPIAPPSFLGSTAGENIARVENIGAKGTERAVDVAAGRRPAGPVNVEQPGKPIQLGGGAGTINPELIARFRKETGTTYNPKSVLDHYNMQQLMANKGTASVKEWKNLGSPKVQAPQLAA